MFQARTSDIPRDKATLYSDLKSDLTGLLTDERDAIANAANLSALLFTTLPDLNWAGFYFMRNAAPKTLDGGNLGGTRELVLGPFQGKPACVRIAVGRGVCGTAVERRQSVLVEDVHAFPGHIACDAASRSELVVPLILDGQVLGVIDLDSPNPARFDAQDQAGIEALAELFVTGSDWPL
ncbi:GAF domain-containing protein [Nitrospirillum amazonense]|uniref:GAF domain-containing protein n=1 Tax=Nitrospirillum amazonense TaxID=28077 RepID=A0A560FFW7_9PROT|nr:GAF domain-containing protein [Nitrospirillum amazonense]TWB20502.1 GAF domain-containing protein [Nitrospirillum amazonense]